MSRFCLYAGGLALALTLWAPTTLRADEGMFLFTSPPTAQLAQKYSYQLTPQWLQGAMQGAVRFNSGGSGGFISASGLVLTNHHIAEDTIAALSTKERNLLAQGFLARTPQEELPAPQLELNALQEIIDVTSQVERGITPQTPPAEAQAIRRRHIAQLESDYQKERQLKAEVVSLYQGGLYHLYLYKKYTDVRLVWAPEQSVAFFGGDADNFEYPRTCLDAAIFRVYEDGKPVRPSHYFPLRPQSLEEGDLVLVVGHPGRTNRLESSSQMEYTRQKALPYRLARTRALESAYRQLGERSPELARQVSNELRSIANSHKAYQGMFQGLCRREIMERKAELEDNLRRQVKDQSPWEELAEIFKPRLSQLEEPYLLLEGSQAYPSPLVLNARHLWRLAQLKEDPQKSLPEYAPARLASLEAQLFSSAPLYPDVERVRLEASLSFMAERLGPSHPYVQAVLQGLSPQELARKLVEGTRFFDPQWRRQVAQLSLAELEKVEDPCLELARQIDPLARKLRNQYESLVQAPATAAYSQMARQRFQLEGLSVPPDATFTLRLAYGQVSGYQAGGTEVAPWTTLGDLYAKAQERGQTPPSKLPERWLEAKEKLDLTLPLNFIATSDTIGGNSGSPVLDGQGRLAGVNFDRNQYAMVRNYVYDEAQARHISVAAPALLESLQKVYGASSLVQELLAP